MKRKNKIANLFRRDEILVNSILGAGFAAFLMSTFYGLSDFALKLLVGKFTLADDISRLGYLGMGLFFFLGILYLQTIAKKEHFGKRSALLVSFLVAICFAINLYIEGLGAWGILFVGVFMAGLFYILFNWLFKEIAKSLN